MIQRTVHLAVLPLLLCLASSQALAQPDPMHLIWKNGDTLPGQLQASETGSIDWKSDLFDVQVSVDALEAVIFPTPRQTPSGSFRIMTLRGDVLTADLVGSTDESLEFRNSHFGDFSIRRNAIKSMVTTNVETALFDGSKYESWQPTAPFPLRQLRYRVYQKDAPWWRNFPDFDKLAPIKQGLIQDGKLDINVARVEGQYGVRYDGQLFVPRDGSYRFAISVDDLAQLYIDDRLISSASVGRDTFERVQLKAGAHRLRLDFVEFGVAGRLSVELSGPGLPGVELSRVRRSPAWYRSPRGFAATTRRQATMFRPLQLPKSFDIVVELAAKRYPQFVLGIGRDVENSFSEDALKLETHDNEIVFAQGDVFELVATLDKKTQSSIRLRVSYDHASETLTVFDDRGKRLASAEGVKLQTGESGLAIRNRASDLTLRHLRVLRRSDGSPSSTSASGTPASASSVTLTNGIVHAGLFVFEDDAPYVLDGDGKRTPIDLAEVESLTMPQSNAEKWAASNELIYADGTLVHGQLVSTTAESLKFAAQFSTEPLRCALKGAARLQLSAPAPPRIRNALTEDRLFCAAGNFGGTLVFGENAAPLSWRPAGARNTIDLRTVDGSKVMRSARETSEEHNDDASQNLPHRVHLRNGEVIPCQIISYDQSQLSLRSRYLEGTTLPAEELKAVEFQPWKDDAANEEGDRQQSARSNSDSNRFRRRPMTGREQRNLTRALTVPRFRRNSPPTHLIVAINGDIKRGSWIGLRGNFAEFDSKLKRFSIPIDKVARIVSVSSTEESPVAEAQAAAAHVALDNGAQFAFNPTASDGKTLWGTSPLYGNVSLPVSSLSILRLQGYETDAIVSEFAEWVVREAEEP